jgi:hypothetical protein
MWYTDKTADHDVKWSKPGSERQRFHVPHIWNIQKISIYTNTNMIIYIRVCVCVCVCVCVWRVLIIGLFVETRGEGGEKRMIKEWTIWNNLQVYRKKT